VEVDETLNQLTALVKKSKQNKKKLSVTDIEIAREKLQALLENPEYTSRACQLIPDLPDSCCQAVLDAWRVSDRDHREKIVRLLLEEPALTGVAGLSRKITLVTAFIPVDNRVALRLLIDLSGQLTQDGTKPPARPLASRFWKELMATKKLLRIPLGEYDITTREIAGIAAMVLFGMLERPEADIALKSDLVNWLGQCRSRATLGTSLVTEVEKVTKNWPEDLQRRCQKLGLIRTISYRIATDWTEKPVFTESKVQANHTPAPSENIGSTNTKNLPAGHDTSPGPVLETREPAAGPSVELNVQTCIDWLTQYIAALEKENASLKKKLNSLEMEYQREKMRNVEKEKQLTDLLEVQSQRETLIQDLSKQITGLENEKRELVNTLQEERFAREKEVESLKIRIDRECSYVLEEFRNRLLDRLSGHYRGYLEAKEKPPTIQLAEYLKFVLDRVFRELINQGVRLNGDE
jgi:hypothetical protein